MVTTAENPTDATGILHFVMVKPSHYDDDGYPIQWIRSAIPSNTLACLNGLAEDAKRRQILGPGVDIRLHTYDETNRRVRIPHRWLPRHAARDAARDGRGTGDGDLLLCRRGRGTADRCGDAGCLE